MPSHHEQAMPITAQPRPISDALTAFAGQQRTRLMIGGVALVITLAGFMLDRPAFFRAWLVACMLWGGLSLGCLGVLMLYNVTGGMWGAAIRRQLEAGARAIPFMGLFFLPLLLGLKDLYLWSHPDAVARDHVLQIKSAYLNPGFFTVRMVLYFTIWSGMAYLLTGLLRKHDATGDLAVARRIRQVSGPGLALYIISMTFASVDWVMSLEPHWYSTIFGIWFCVAQALSTFAFMIPMTIFLAGFTPFAKRITRGQVYDLGNLMLAFTMLWSYMAMSQLLIIWAGNLPEEIPWYVKRFKDGWGWVGLAVVLGQFAIPFTLLVLRPIKSSPALLARVALFIFLMRYVDLYWMIGPAVDSSVPLHFSWLYLTAPVAIGGIWLGLFFGQLRARWQEPFRDVHAHFDEPVYGALEHV